MTLEMSLLFGMMPSVSSEEERCSTWAICLGCAGRLRWPGLRMRLLAAAGVCRMQVIEYAARLCDRFVVVARLFAHAAKQRLEPLRVGHRNASRVEEMHCGADRCQGTIGLEAKARQQDLEGDAATHVGEFRAVEVEAHGPLRTIARRVDPCEARIGVDESLDEPGAREAIDPWRLARGPHAPAA